LFAFGIVAYELLTGTHPFTRPTVTETMGAVLRDDAPSLARAVRDLHPAIARVLSQCLEKAPADRLGSARDLAIYLDALSNAPDVATGDGSLMTSDTRKRVGRRVFYSSLAIILSLVALIWGYAEFTTGRGESTTSDLAGAERLIQRVQAERLAQLALTARLIASFPEVKALFGTDSATVRDFLSSQQAIVPGAPALIAILPDRRILARTDTAADVPTSTGDEWIDTLLTNHDGTAVVTIDGRLYHAARATSDAGGNTFGHIVAATPVDEGFARALSDAAHDEVVLLSDAMSASTLPGSQTPWRSLQDWRSAGGRTDRAMPVDIDGRAFDAREILLSERPALSAVVAESRDAAATPTRRLQSGLAVVGLIAVLAAIAAAFWITLVVNPR
jgi:hypothetical protein